MKLYPLSFVLILFLIITCTSPKDHSLTIHLDSATDSLELFAEGLISTELNERDMAISPDGTEIFYSIFSYDNSIRVLMQVKKENEVWSQPAPAPFAGEHFDLEPAFAPDGQTLFFVSDRPMFPSDSTEDHNIWYVKRTETGWSDPSPLSTLINTEAEEFYPSVGSSGNLYFTARYPGGLGGEDIYLSRLVDGVYAQPEPLGEGVNSANWEFNAYVSPDEDLLIFSSFGREDGFGGGDLYLSTKDASGNWTPARNLGPVINSVKLDYCPFIDWPRNTFYFTSNRGAVPPERILGIQDFHVIAGQALNGMANIFRIDLAALNL